VRRVVVRRYRSGERTCHARAPSDVRRLVATPDQYRARVSQSVVLGDGVGVDGCIVEKSKFAARHYWHMLFYSTVAAVESIHPRPRTRAPAQQTMRQGRDAFRQGGSDV
jgi:hypothetical protein